MTKMQTMLNSDQQAGFDPLYVTHSPHQSSARLSVGLCGWVIPCRRLSFPTLAFVFGCGQAKGSATCFTQSCKSQSHRKTQTISKNKEKRQACCAVRFCSVFVILRAPLHSEILQDLMDSIPLSTPSLSALGILVSLRSSSSFQRQTQKIGQWLRGKAS